MLPEILMAKAKAKSKSKLKRLELTITRSLSKKEILNRIKKELDKEFPTDVVEDRDITVTCDHEATCPPKLSKKR